MFKVGDRVKWTSSNTLKTGEVVAVVPAGRLPTDVGFPKAGGGGMRRKHESYIVRGRKHGYDGQLYGSQAAYWPITSLLVPA